MTSPPALFAAYPVLAGRVPWTSLGTLPTAVERVAGVLPSSVELWVKRDDRSGARYGGNKVRKLEFLLADAARRGARRLVTVGAWGSNHVLATALYGRAMGFEVDAVVFPQPLVPSVRANILYDLAVGARLLPVRSVAGVPGALARARLEWPRPNDVRIVAPGGSSPLGTLGYVSAGLELMAQVRAGECPAPDVVYVTLGSCGTAAGLWLGLGLGGYHGRIVAVRVVDRLVSNRFALRRLLRGAARLLVRAGADVSLDDLPELTIEQGQFGPGYARRTPADDEAVARAGRSGIGLETTYTGKTFAALIADAEAGRLDGQRALFINTYSSVDLTPLRAADAELPPIPRALAPIFDGTGKLA